MAQSDKSKQNRWQITPLSPPLGEKDQHIVPFGPSQLPSSFQPSSIWSQPAPWYPEIPQRSRSSSMIPLLPPMSASFLDHNTPEDYFSHHPVSVNKSPFPSPLFPLSSSTKNNSIWSFDYSSVVHNRDEEQRRHSIAVTQHIRPPTPPLQQNQQQQIDEYFSPTTACMDVQYLGKGIPLNDLPEDQTVYQVEFKAKYRSDYAYVQQDANLSFCLNDMVIVEADRGYDLGKVIGLLDKHSTPVDQIKRIFRHANSAELTTYEQKEQDEQKALATCQSKIKQKNLNMEVVDAEYQWDRRKLTFYFKATERIDFRELVRELFKIYKTRIWMCAYTDKSSENIM
ncbi:PSP1 C-terminal conserved region-domain-containing protein [Gilbertella persicaria]|uniref:PSP1 C-terminal domain-containing protein n=1 Tax=Rhizopus stolonifer TaxID=4846 RepID=A0A367KNU4_RHIST|nr:PSP1 C-terminal conserved region-domain-containing protein [Gilbertella persicaria]KAI8092218.1 PSP1 C-terminal conserved region-domain-containing protein [Gilbertella persicaria]RCI03873.1 hypothetical protein CU098_007079 [Rhizopus stolonifer]